MIRFEAALEVHEAKEVKRRQKSMMLLKRKAHVSHHDWFRKHYFIRITLDG